VGAHRSHLGASDWRATILCSDCHQVPEAMGTEGHLDGPPADLTFSRTAVAGGATPDYVADGGCGNVYCHGATLDAGGTNTDPDWVTVDGTQAACGDCHNTGSNPSILGGRHSQHLREGLDCADCHNTLNGSGDIVRPAQHIDGVVEFEPSGSDLVFDGTRCNGPCHGEQHRNRSW
jgi:predicted CxxxxCH...CXXCH cytochrome family protein